MSVDPRAEVTLCLERLRAGDARAGEELLPLVYEELRGMAARLLQERAHTLQATALVHEAWLKLARREGGEASWESRAHFVAVAAKAMRHVLVNHARDRRAKKRGGDAAKLTLDECLGLVEQDTGDLVALDDLLSRLAELDERQARVVELRVFGGLGIEEVAVALGVGQTTVKADWRFARSWLRRELGREVEDEER
ncbi:MAG: sigma-70 family RNA polymerase sigma factor [Planctomycetes bacterium]|nr:sigma-70 family RNA polymerase sigma factor [Planctomycetota bacterium]